MGKSFFTAKPAAVQAMLTKYRQKQVDLNSRSWYIQIIKGIYQL